MKILLLAPHPFYQERGTPIAVDLLVRVLSARGYSVDVLTYHEGADRSYPGVTIHRIDRPRLVRGVAPGFSWKKVVCDLHMLARLRALLRQHRYDLVHAVEESVFLARWVCTSRGIPYVFDMDSSMPRQMAEKFPALRLLLPAMRWFERHAVRDALAVVAVCDALADLARAYGARQVFLLRDVSLLRSGPHELRESLRAQRGLAGTTFLYVGNLEKYQGIDLLLESFAMAARDGMAADLVIAGGAAGDLERYHRRAAALGIEGRTHFLGPQPVERMDWLFESADVLVSPRTRGENTPMKIYSYLDSGKAILATDLPTHTQVLNGEVAALAPPEPAAFAQAMLALAGDPARRQRLGAAAHALAEREYSLAAYQRQANALYDRLEAILPSRGGPPGTGVPP